MKTADVVFRLLLAFACAFVTLRFAETPPVQGQSDAVLSGIVTTKDGKPIPGVLIYGSESKTCCPFKREQTRTDDSGHFSLKNPGAVVHFSAEKFDSKASIVRPETTEFRLILEPKTNALTVPTCDRSAPGTRRIPGEKGDGLRFDMPKKNLTLLGGKMDVDYRKFVIKTKKGSSYLALWFGPYAFNSDPGDDLYLKSAGFSQRSVTGETWGSDVSGQLKTGERWRHTYFGLGNGANYQASPADAAVFDQIVNSACMIKRTDAP
jgi:hypothetical protein